MSRKKIDQKWVQENLLEVLLESSRDAGRVFVGGELSEDEMCKQIFKNLTTKRYRSSSMSDVLNKSVKDKIEMAVSKNQPIHLTVPFGGYKLWTLPTYPNPDWSEVFNIKQLVNYLLPITHSYDPGVVLEYFSDEIMVSRMNGVPQKDLNSYTDQMRKLVVWLDQKTPKNMKLKFSRIRDQISQKEYWRRIDADMERVKGLWEDLSSEEQAVRLKKAERNYMGKLPKKKSDREKVLLEASLGHDGFIFGDWRDGVPWAFDKHMIALGFRYTGDWGLPLRSTRSSVNQFWVGTGIVRKRGDELIPASLTLSQFKSIEKRAEYVDVAIFPDEFSNLQKIGVVEEV